MGNRLLDVIDLSTQFITPHGVFKAVDRVSFHVDEKETLGLVGESGCGKSVTCLSILRLLPQPAGKIVGGRILFEGEDLRTLNERRLQRVRGGKISMILQDPMASLNPVFNIGDQISEAIATHLLLKKAGLRAKVEEKLRQVKIPSPESRMNDFPHQLSGGMKQRVVGAIAISCRPKLLIADEPTTSLDVTIQAQYLQLLKDLQREMGMSIIFITHDFGVVATMCDRVAVMYAGRIVETGPVREIFYHPAHCYTAALMEAVPKLGRHVDRLVSIPGHPPRLDSLGAGCRFAPRCAQPTEKCQSEEPPNVEVGPEHYASCWRIQGKT